MMQHQTVALLVLLVLVAVLNHLYKSSPPDTRGFKIIKTLLPSNATVNGMNAINSATGKVFRGERIRTYDGERRFSVSVSFADGNRNRDSKDEKTIRWELRKMERCDNDFCTHRGRAQGIERERLVHCDCGRYENPPQLHGRTDEGQHQRIHQHGHQYGDDAQYSKQEWRLNSLFIGRRPTRMDGSRTRPDER
eukprot:GHVN01059534.1.p2 GENE.GHVN01059534.1~~GHVN01059534.1.p2  ORF type:complete len:193 (+),score=16.09 GHVN01059534.1:123-701(+)